ncbi:MAG: general secretion pathway protein D [Pseudohongiellaceae bacterium]|jgi:general secretion pathway protein D
MIERHHHPMKQPTIKQGFLYSLLNIFFSTGLIISAPCYAQTTRVNTQDVAQTSNELITINMHEAEIVSVIQWIAEQTNKKIIIDPRVKGKVSILANVPMTVDNAYQVFLAMLDVYGYASIETGDILRIVPSAAAKTSPASIINNFNDERGSSQALYVYQIQNSDPQKILTAIKPLVGTHGYANHITNTNKIIIADAYSNIKRLASLINQIDQAEDLSIKTLALEHASATTVAAVINSLLENNGSKTFTIASDERSNSLLMTGDIMIEKRVKQLISQLDRPITNTDNTKVIYLHYIDADELLPILKNMGDTIKQENKYYNVEQQAISIAASKSANALVVTAPPDILYAMEKVIAQIDIRRAQVLVEAIIVEVSEELAQSLGVEWNTSFSASTGVEAATNFGLRQNNANAVESILSSGLALGYYSSGSLRALVNALATEIDANILSTPSLMTLDNQEAEILVGSNVPFITGQTLNNSTSNNEPFTTISRVDIGLTLRVTPQINDKDSVTLDIVQELETISDSVTGAQDLVTNKRSIKTKVLVKNDNILVLGGLITDEETELVNKVPLLGDIPLLGELFKTTTTKKSKRNLMVFIHPKIITDTVSGETLSSGKYQQMQELRESYKP